MPLRPAPYALPTGRVPEIGPLPLGLLRALVLGALLLAALPGSVAADYDEIGGDDVQIVKLEVAQSHGPVMDIAENGDIYVAVCVDLTDRYAVYFYRSQDGGTDWAYWGRLDSTDVDYRHPSLHIAEGTQDRVFVAFTYQGPSEARPQIRVAYSPLSVASASWTVQTALATATDDFGRVCLDSDETNYDSYYLYLAAEAADGNGNDIWFTRSKDYGATWESGYKIGSLATGGHFLDPVIRYGRSGGLHCLWMFYPTSETADWAMRYRHAANWGEGGYGDWDPILYLSSASDGLDEHNPSLAASHGTDHVLATWMILDGSSAIGSGARSSSDAGATWSDAQETPSLNVRGVLALPSGGGFSICGNAGAFRDGFQSATDADPLGWSDHQTIVDRDYYGIQTALGYARGHDYDPTRGNRNAMVWAVENYAGTDTLFFDAEWRRDPGYANLEPGFPLGLTSSVVAPPAICELDGDPESEIVFGLEDGRIVALDHDGSALPGWPVDIGTFQADATIAVGDITGDGRSDVVAGNATGYVYAFDRAGAELPGWPRNTGTAAPAYVALGAITTENRQVAVGSGTKVGLYRGSGTPEPNFPVTVAGTISAAPAIGDVDGDGDREIVILQQQYMDVFRGDGTVQAYRNLTSAGQTFSNSPTLGDLNLDGDLEIVAPTDQGRLYVMNPDGTDYPGGWPYVDPAGLRLTSVALAQILGTDEPELIFGVEDAGAPEVHVLYQDMDEAYNFPQPTGDGWYIRAMPTVDVLDGGSPDVILPSRDKQVHAWTNLGAVLPGWPESLGSSANVSAASGDIDSDGNVEVVVATMSPAQLLVYDMGATVDRHPSHRTRWWPMYGYNALRQGCLACDEDRVTDVPGTGPVARTLSFAAPAPTPTTGTVAVSFELPEAAAVRLDLFDAQGRRVARLLKEEMGAGTHRHSWDLRAQAGTELASGVYYLRLGVSGPSVSRELTRRVVLVH
jgi:hypothetical protein